MVQKQRWTIALKMQHKRLTRTLWDETQRYKTMADTCIENTVQGVGGEGGGAGGGGEGWRGAQVDSYEDR